MTHRTDAPTTLKKGLYRHYKGWTVYVLKLILFIEKDREVWSAEYISIPDGKVTMARTLDEFTEPVVWPDGVTRPRFVHVGQVSDSQPDT